jgi:hypothetical protein
MQAGYDEIKYLPGPGDPVFTEVGMTDGRSGTGVKFSANVAVQVSKKTTVLVPLRKEITLADGSVVTRAVETRIPLVEILRFNPSFCVNGEQPVKQAAKARVPTDPDQYRGYAIDWIANCTDANALEKQWAGEAHLRETLGVNERELAYISPFFEARIRALRHGAVMVPALPM